MRGTTPGERPSHQSRMSLSAYGFRCWMFIDGFGSSELGWGGVLGRVTVAGSETSDRCIGQPQPFADVTVLRPDGMPADDYEVGLLAVKGPTITPGTGTTPT